MLIKPDKKSLMLSRMWWESRHLKEVGYNFSKEELDAAENKKVKFIGNRNGVDCYITPKFN